MYFEEYLIQCLWDPKINQISKHIKKTDQSSLPMLCYFACFVSLTFLRFEAGSVSGPSSKYLPLVLPAQPGS